MTKPNKKRKSRGQRKFPEIDALSSKLKHKKKCDMINIKNDQKKNEEDDNNSLFVGETTKTKVEKKRKKKKMSGRKSKSAFIHRDKSATAEGTESQSFMAMIVKHNESNRKAAKATKDFFKKFTRKVEERTENLQNHITNLANISSKSDKDFLRSYQIAYELSRPSNLQQQQQESSAKEFVFASLYPRTHELISKAQGVIRVFETTNEKIRNLIDMNSLQGSGVKWDDQITQVEQLLRIGQQVGMDRYLSMIQGGDKENKKGRLNCEGEVAAVAEDAERVRVDEIIYQAENLLHGDSSWGVVAQKQMRALKRLVKVSQGEGGVS